MRIRVFVSALLLMTTCCDHAIAKDVTFTLRYTLKCIRSKPPGFPVRIVLLGTVHPANIFCYAFPLVSLLYRI